MKTSVFDSEYQLKSLASVLRGMRRALDANELAERLGVSKRTIMRKVKEGHNPVFQDRHWLLKQCGVKSMRNIDVESRK
ncbi:MAG: hypothetical protein DMG88_06125 [Acidobacteria bacterium]|nr:MAG: hypothetical protein DMG88_06125 [Acidobacteriota bacterium]